jgi:8-oxo-dGTP pyrophosphatase MutT (NUDIX family)
MTCKMKPHKTSGGILTDPEKHIWKWDKAKWTKCCQCGLTHSNRKIPEKYWDRDWFTSKNEREKVGIMLIKNCKQVWMTESYHRCYGFPKGEKEYGESRIECAKREFLEETGSDKLENYNLENCTKIVTSIENITYIFYVVHVGSKFDILEVPEDDVEITSFGWMLLVDIGKTKLSKAIRKIYNTYNKNILDYKRKYSDRKRFFNSKFKNNKSFF